MPQNSGPLQSEFASDAEMRDLIAMFVQELPSRIAELERAFNEADMQTLMRYSHQLKGAAPGYGFTPVGQAAATLEQSVLSGRNAELLRLELESLIDLCKRAIV